MSDPTTVYKKGKFDIDIGRRGHAFARVMSSDIRSAKSAT